jgi:hypothetical protein
MCGEPGGHAARQAGRGLHLRRWALMRMRPSLLVGRRGGGDEPARGAGGGCATEASSSFERLRRQSAWPLGCPTRGAAELRRHETPWLQSHVQSVSMLVSAFQPAAVALVNF